MGSEKAVLDGSKAIRGGIPLVFPNFGAWECGPSHGFARISEWTWDEAAAEAGDTEDATRATFVLEDNEQTRAMWKHSFRLEYTVCLTDSTLETTLKVCVDGEFLSPLLCYSFVKLRCIVVV